MKKLEQVIEKVANALETETDVTLSPEELKILSGFGEGVISGVEKKAAEAYAIEVPVKDYVEKLAEENPEAVVEFQKEILGEELTKEASEKDYDGLSMLIDPRGFVLGIYKMEEE